MKVLFIGGTGLISTAVSKLAVKEGIELYLLNRGSNVVNDAISLKGDIHNENQIKQLIADLTFDVVVDWIAFEKADVERDVRLFKGKTKQYIFISSASAYIKPLPAYPITEKTPLGNKYWTYSDNKRICEEYLQSVHSDDFNVTIIRPAHTYNDEKVVMCIKAWAHPFTTIKRIMDGKPTIIPGNGRSLWTLTYNQDFAKAFVKVLGNPLAYGEDFHITSDFTYTWDQLNDIISKELGVESNVIHIPTDFIIKYIPWLEGELAGDKDWSLIFDNSKIKKIAPAYEATTRYEEIAPKAVKRYLENKELQTIDEEYDRLLDKVIEEYVKL